MRTVLFGWELGDGLGHVTRMLPLAKRLREAGHHCLFAVRSPATVHSLLSRERFALVQAPFAQIVEAAAWRGRPLVGYGDILAGIGFADPAWLSAQVQAWQGLIDLIRPALIVADFAPILCLASYEAVPTVLLGDGFTLPPAAASTLPHFRDGSLRVPEERLLEVVHTVQRQRNRPAPSTMPGLFAGCGAFVVTLPELDPYARQRARPALGPLSPLPPPARHPPDIDYFAYLSTAYSGTAQVLRALAAGNASGTLFLREATQDQRQELRSQGLSVLDEPAVLQNLTAAAVIHHGGLGTTETTLALGRPQLIVPRHLEQMQNAKTVLALGVGVSMTGNGTFQPRHVQAALDHILNSATVRESATRQAERIAALAPFDGLDQLTEFCAGELGAS